MIAAFVKRPAMTIMLIAVFVILGLYSYFNLIIERQPRVEFPIVTVQTIYPGASPEEIESQIIEKIEDVVSEISEIDKIRADALANVGIVVIEFDLNADVNVKASEVKDKVEAIRNQLPDGAEAPVIAKFDPLVEPILDLVLISDKVDERSLYDMADNRVKDAITRIAGVASVDVTGGKQRQINVDIDPFLMEQKYLTLDEVIRAIRGANLNVPGGSMERDYDEVSVRFEGEFSSLSDIENLMVTSQEGRAYPLKSFATIVDGAKDVESLTTYNSKNAVGIAINKLSDGDAVSIAEAIKAQVPKLAQQLGESVELVIAYDSTKNILKTTNDTVFNIIVGMALTIFILYSFLGNFRVTFIAAIVLPTSLVSTFLLMDFSSFSINFMTLLAIGTALGTLIANAIVIIESVSALIENGMSPTEAAIEGTRRVSFAVIASAGTNLVVFTPIAFMGGIVGKFMLSFGLTVVYATIFSVIASFTLTPMLCARLLKSSAERNKKSVFTYLLIPFEWLIVKPVNALVAFLINEYRYLFHAMFKLPWLAIVIALGIFVSPIAVLPYVGGEFLSSSDVNMIKLKVEAPQGTPLEKTSKIVASLETIVSGVKEVESYFSTTGENGAENAVLTVNLVDRSERERSDKQIMEALAPEVSKLAGAIITIERGASGPGGGQADVSLDIYGKNYDQMVVISEELQSIMLESGNFSSVVTTHKKPREEVVFRPDREKLFESGINSAKVGSLIRTAISGNTDAKYKEDNEEYDIQVRVRREYAESLEDVANLAVQTRSGSLPLSSFGELSMERSLPPLKRRDKQRLIQLNGFLSRSTASEVMADLNERFKTVEFPEGYTYKFVGNAENMEESSREISKAFLLAVVLTYMLLAAILNSFIHPFTIVSSVFTAFAGVFYALFFFEFTINIGSMMAMVMLVGLAVNNAILLLDETQVQIDSGLSIKEALWEASVVKFRPILMASLAIIAGTLPQVFDPDITKASMGAVILGGMLASVLFTYILTPLAYYYLERLRRFFAPKVKSSEKPPEKLSA